MRSRVLAIALALACAGAPWAAHATPPCDQNTGAPFAYCGKHIRLSALPLRLYVQTSGEPASVAGQTAAAARAAAAEWNEAWPIPSATSPTCAVICIVGSSSSADGTISWGSPSACGVPADSNAATCFPATATAPDGTMRIVRANVVLSVSQGWLWPQAPRDVAVGVTRAGALNDYSFGMIGDVDWHDLQSTLAHELGHAIGLEHFGDPSASWPSDVRATAGFTDVMYRFGYPGSTNKRALGAGDVAALMLDAAETARDP